MICASGGDESAATSVALGRRLPESRLTVDLNALFLERRAKRAGGEQRRIVDDERILERPRVRADGSAHDDCAVGAPHRADVAARTGHETHGALDRNHRRCRLERHERIATRRANRDPHQVLVQRQRRYARCVCRAQVARLPTVGNQLVLERGGVADDVAAHALDAGGRDLFRQHFHRLFVVPEARTHRRIADALQIQIAGERSVVADRAVAQHGRVKREVGSELIERDGRRVHLHRRRRLHHSVGVLREERVAARERDDDRAPLAPARVTRQRRSNGARQSGDPARIRRRGRSADRPASSPLRRASVVPVRLPFASVPSQSSRQIPEPGRQRRRRLEVMMSSCSANGQHRYPEAVGSRNCD